MFVSLLRCKNQFHRSAISALQRSRLPTCGHDGGRQARAHVCARARLTLPRMDFSIKQLAIRPALPTLQSPVILFWCASLFTMFIITSHNVLSVGMSYRGELAEPLAALRHTWELVWLFPEVSLPQSAGSLETRQPLNRHGLSTFG